MNVQYPDQLKRRGLKLASRGEYRKAALALRERASLVDDGASWVLLGAMLTRAGRHDDAADAYRTGAYHHRRVGSHARARVASLLLQRA